MHDEVLRPNGAKLATSGLYNSIWLWIERQTAVPVTTQLTVLAIKPIPNMAECRNA